MPDVVLHLIDESDYAPLCGILMRTGSAGLIAATGEELTRERCETELRKLRHDKSVVLRAIRADEDAVGIIIATDTGRVPQVSFLVDPPHQNHGFATAALLAFTTMMTRRPLQAWVAASNLAAIRVLEKAGFAPDRALPESSNEICFELGFFPAPTFVGTTAS